MTIDAVCESLAEVAGDSPTALSCLPKIDRDPFNPTERLSSWMTDPTAIHHSPPIPFPLIPSKHLSMSNHRPGCWVMRMLSGTWA